MYAVELFSTLRQKEIIGQLPDVIEDLVIDSRSVQAGSVFICIKGYTVDGHDYASKAVEAGASVIVTERPLTLPDTVAQIVHLAFYLLNFMIIHQRI
jgi:UDP-N-acetylmuramoyl-L-alanyl-D-glutamate-L-lysine ligase